MTACPLCIANVKHTHTREDTMTEAEPRPVGLTRAQMLGLSPEAEAAEDEQAQHRLDEQRDER